MISRQLGSYVVVAGLCAALNIIIMIAGDSAGFHYVASTACSFGTCVLIGYVLHARWTFRTEQRVDGLARYAAAMSTNFPANLVCIWMLYDVANLRMMIAAPLATAMTVGANFLLSRWAIVSPAGDQE